MKKYCPSCNKWKDVPPNIHTCTTRRCNSPLKVEQHCTQCGNQILILSAIAEGLEPMPMPIQCDICGALITRRSKYYLVKAIKADYLRFDTFHTYRDQTDRWCIFLAGVTKYQALPCRGGFCPSGPSLDMSLFQDFSLRLEKEDPRHLHTHYYRRFERPKEEEADKEFYTFGLPPLADPSEVHVMTHAWDRREPQPRKMAWDETRNRFRPAQSLYPEALTAFYSKSQSTSVIIIDLDEESFPHNPRAETNWFSRHTVHSGKGGRQHIVWARVKLAPQLFGDKKTTLAKSFFSAVIFPADSCFALPSRYFGSDVGTFLRPYDFTIPPRSEKTTEDEDILPEELKRKRAFKQVASLREVSQLDDEYTEVMAKLRWTAPMKCPAVAFSSSDRPPLAAVASSSSDRPPPPPAPELPPPADSAFPPAATAAPPSASHFMVKRPSLFCYLRPNYYNGIPPDVWKEGVVQHDLDGFTTSMSMGFMFCRGFDLMFKLRRLDPAYSAPVDFFFYLPGEAWGDNLPGLGRTSTLKQTLSHQYERGRLMSLSDPGLKIPYIDIETLMAFLASEGENFFQFKAKENPAYTAKLDYVPQLIVLNILQKFFWDHPFRNLDCSEIPIPEALDPSLTPAQKIQKILLIDDRLMDQLRKALNFLRQYKNIEDSTNKVLGSESLLCRMFNMPYRGHDIRPTKSWITRICRRVGILIDHLNLDTPAGPSSASDLSCLQWLFIATFQLATAPVQGGYLETKIKALEFLIWSTERLNFCAAGHPLCHLDRPLNPFSERPEELHVTPILEEIKLAGGAQVLIDIITYNYSKVAQEKDLGCLNIDCLWKFPPLFLPPDISPYLTGGRVDPAAFKVWGDKLKYILAFLSGFLD